MDNTFGHFNHMLDVILFLKQDIPNETFKLKNILKGIQIKAKNLLIKICYGNSASDSYVTLTLWGKTVMYFMCSRCSLDMRYDDCNDMCNLLIGKQLSHQMVKSAVNLSEFN